MEAAEAGDNEEGGDVFSQETGAGGAQQPATIVICITRILDIVTVGRRAARQVRPQHPRAEPQGVPAPAGRPRPRGAVVSTATSGGGSGVVRSSNL